MEKLKTFTTLVLFLLTTCLFGQTVSDLRPTVTMKEYVDMQAELNKEWMGKYIDAQIMNINDNVIRANLANEKRFENVNEFRNTLKDQQGTFMTRSEMIAWLGFAMALVFGLKNTFFRTNDKPEGKAIISGDKVEVKK